MPNEYFRFKKFLIKQDKCAMKVCTDSCILGASTPVNNVKSILDIGTGTGLLSLMLAQRSSAFIDAVEIEAGAAHQARDNISHSPWADQIKIYNQSLQSFAAQSAKVYDLIICNPPFYSSSPKSENKARNVAMHSQELTLPALTDLSTSLLSPAGRFFILLPPAESQLFSTLASAADLHLISALRIFTSKNNGKHIRTVQGFSRLPAKTVEEDLYIRNPDNAYTPAFTELLRDYYLIF